MKKLNLIFILLFAISALGFSQNDSVTISLNDTIKLELVREVFQKKTHSVKYLNDTDLLIDNQIIFGTDGKSLDTNLKVPRLK